MHLDVLTSYRKEKEKATRMAGVIRASGVENKSLTHRFRTRMVG